MGQDQILAVYAVGDTVYAATYGGLSISTDGGNTFTNKTTKQGLGSNQVKGVYAVGNTIYAATYGGLSISTDGGTTFVNKTTADGLGTNEVDGVYVVDNMVYAATDNGLGVSTDRGVSFTNRTMATTLYGSNQLTGVYAVGLTVYVASIGGLHISTDGGTTFTQKSTDQGLGSNEMLGVYAQGNTVYAATIGGLSISTDGGKHFTNYTPANTNQGLGAKQVNAISVSGDRLYVATEGGGLSYCPPLVNAPTLTGLTASPNPVVSGQPVTFSATVGNLTGSYSYTLSNGAVTPISGTASSSVFSQSLTAQGSGLQTFTLTVATNDGVATATTSLTVLAKPVTLTGLSASPNPVVSGQSTTFRATVGNVTGPYSYTLSNGADTPRTSTASGTSFSQALTASGTGPQTYTLRVAAEGGVATASTSLSVLASPITITGLTASPNPVVTGQSLEFTTTLSGLIETDIYSYTLTNGQEAIPLTGDFHGPDFRESATAQGVGPQTYTLTVTTQKGRATASVSVIVTQERITLELERFAILGVTGVSCEPVGGVTGGERRVTFTPQYVKANGEPIRFSVVNELAPTTQPGPYSLTLYTDNPTITLKAQQGERGEVRYIFHWLAACPTGNTQPQAPTTSGIPSQTLLQGQPYRLELTRYVTDPDGQTPQFTVLGLPSGLSLTESLISGTPSATGTYPVSLTATDPGALSIIASFTLTVVPASSSPSGFTIVGVSPVSCELVDPLKRGYQVSFTPQYGGLTGEPISFSVINELNATTSPGPYTLGLYADNPVITLKATQAGSPQEARFSYHWLGACPPAAVNPASFSLVSVTTVRCEVVSAGERRLTFTPHYAGLDGSPVSFSVVNELAPTTSAGPYTLRLYTDNPTITLSAQQGASLATYGYNWLAGCTAPARLGVSEPVTGLEVTVLGNPVVGNRVVVEVRGAEGQPLHYEWLDLQGRQVGQHQVAQAGAVDRQALWLGSYSGGGLVLRVSTPRRQQTLKLLKAD